MDAIELLSTQHRDVEDLFEECESASGEQKEELFNQLADALAAHALIEEQIFYPESKSGRTEEQLREAVEEHLSMKRILADMMSAGIDDAQFDAKLEVLKEQVEHHVEEEEGEFFPVVRNLLGGEKLDELGGMMESLYARLIAEGEPRRDIPGDTVEPAPI